jgi:hypothetical protein
MTVEECFPDRNRVISWQAHEHLPYTQGQNSRMVNVLVCQGCGGLVDVDLLDKHVEQRH